MLPRELAIKKPSSESQSQVGLDCLTFPLLTVGGLQKDRLACTAMKQQHQCDYTVNLSRAKRQSQTPATNKLALIGVYGHSDKHASRKILKAQCAFKILMIHEVLQFALHIAFRCVLHRCGSLDIRC